MKELMNQGIWVAKFGPNILHKNWGSEGRRDRTGTFFSAGTIKNVSLFFAKCPFIRA